jgi:hypothetical protein
VAAGGWRCGAREDALPRYRAKRPFEIPIRPLQDRHTEERLATNAASIRIVFSGVKQYVSRGSSAQCGDQLASSLGGLPYRACPPASGAAVLRRARSRSAGQKCLKPLSAWARTAHATGEVNAQTALSRFCRHRLTGMAATVRQSPRGTAGHRLLSVHGPVPGGRGTRSPDPQRAPHLGGCQRLAGRATAHYRLGYSRCCRKKCRPGPC